MTLWTAAELPILENARLVGTPTDDASVGPFQMMLLASITSGMHTELPQDARRFPVIVDTGHSHNFSIREQHLRDWSGVAFDEFRPTGGEVTITTSSREEYRRPLYRGMLWLFGPKGSAPPLKIWLDRGFTLYPDDGDVPGPPIPLVGCRALRTAGIELIADYAALNYSLRITQVRRPHRSTVDLYELTQPQVVTYGELGHDFEVGTHNGDPLRVVVDFDGLPLIDSLTVGLLIARWKQVCRRPGSRLALCGLTKDSHEVISMMNLDRLWDVYPTIDDAVAAFGQHD